MMTMALSQRFEPIDRIHRGTGLIWTLCEPKGEGRPRTDLGPTPSVAPLHFDVRVPSSETLVHAIEDGLPGDRE